MCKLDRLTSQSYGCLTQKQASGIQLIYLEGRGCVLSSRFQMLLSILAGCFHGVVNLEGRPRGTCIR